MKLSIGNFISLGVLMATVIAAGATFQAELNAAKADITRKLTRIERLELQLLEIKERLNRVEVTALNLSRQFGAKNRRSGE